jgi:hypothetical protein
MLDQTDLQMKNLTRRVGLGKRNIGHLNLLSTTPGEFDDAAEQLRGVVLVVLEASLGVFETLKLHESATLFQHMKALRDRSERRAELGEDSIVTGFLNVTEEQHARRAGLEVLPGAAALLAVFVHTIILLRMHTRGLLAEMTTITWNVMSRVLLVHVVLHVIIVAVVATTISHVLTHCEKM